MRLKILVVVRMIKNDDLADLHAYDRGRIDTNDLFRPWKGETGKLRRRESSRQF